MRNYVKLVDFELWRFRKVYLALIAIVVISQLVGTYVTSKSYLNRFDTVVNINGESLNYYLDMYGFMSIMEITMTGWFVYPIMIAAVALLFYCLFIWYRDWFGKNTFIYRLLMLPTARINIFLAKLTTILLLVFGLVALQMILLSISSLIIELMVPAYLRADITAIEYVNGLHGFVNLAMIIPHHWLGFIINYGIGAMAVTVLFTAILFERSYQKKGIVFGLIYLFLAMTLFLTPVLLEIFFLDAPYLYPEEQFIVFCVLWSIVVAVSLWVSHYLLNKKITV